MSEPRESAIAEHDDKSLKLSIIELLGILDDAAVSDTLPSALRQLAIKIRNNFLDPVPAVIDDVVALDMINKEILTARTHNSEDLATKKLEIFSTIAEIRMHPIKENGSSDSYKNLREFINVSRLWFKMEEELLRRQFDDATLGSKRNQ